MNAITKIEAAQSLAFTKPGMHFGLSEEIYHADDALGSGSIRKLEKNAIYYWKDSPLNPLREVKRETDALLFGRALHKLVLEGLEAFQTTYSPIPVPADFPDCVDTATDAKKRLKVLGQKQSGDKAELIARLKAVDASVFIFDEIETAFFEDCRRKGITPLARPVYDKVIASAGMIAADERVRLAFQGGRAEVSLFWVEDGVPMKARLDYLRLGRENGRTIALNSDLKSFENYMEYPPEIAVTRSIASTRLDIQAAAYFRGIAHIPQWIAEGKVHGADEISPEWLSALGAVPLSDWRWFWVFFAKDAPISMLRSTRPGSAMMEAAGMNVTRALSTYRENMARFGTQWRFVDPLPDTEIEQSDLPKWMFLGA